MSHVPKDVKWYLAELVVEVIIEKEPQNTIHTNTVLIRADSPEEAYEKALELGEEENSRYRNPRGSMVEFLFRGLKDLLPIYDHLEHGSELLHAEEVNVPEERIKEMVQPKENLSLFTPVAKEEQPSYVSLDIIGKLRKAGFGKEDEEQ